MMIRHLKSFLSHAAAAAVLLPLALPCSASPFASHQARPSAQPIQQARFNLHGLNGLPVYAATPGMVLFTGYEKGLGQIIDIDQGNGVSTRYAHLNRLLVHPGQTVALHQEIGRVSDTGWAMWPRLWSQTSLH